MIRTKVKGTKFKAASSPDQEPDFYAMPPVTISPESTPQSSPQHQPQMPSDGSSISEASLTPPVSDLFAMFKSAQQAVVDASPYQFMSATAAQPPLPAAIAMPSAPMPAPVAAPMPTTQDQILDKAVDHFFFTGPMSDLGDLNDFVHDWDPNNRMAQSLENDVQLGYMLDRLLAD